VQVNRDFIDLSSAFSAQAVDYLVVGAHALPAHGHVRATSANKKGSGQLQDLAEVERLEEEHAEDRRHREHERKQRK
jgi:hypothetical protein